MYNIMYHYVTLVRHLTHSSEDFPVSSFPLPSNISIVCSIERNGRKFKSKESAIENWWGKTWKLKYVLYLAPFIYIYIYYSLCIRIFQILRPLAPCTHQPLWWRPGLWLRQRDRVLIKLVLARNVWNIPLSLCLREASYSRYALLIANIIN